MESKTLRDYFIAHAPAEPQPWFEPVMPPHPDIPKLSELSAEDREDWNSEKIDYAPSACSEVLRSFAERREAACDAVKQWNKQREKERYIQWPAAWADAMLKVRGSV